MKTPRKNDRRHPDFESKESLRARIAELEAEVARLSRAWWVRAWARVKAWWSP